MSQVLELEKQNAAEPRYHGKIQARFSRLLDMFLDAHPTGMLTLETDILLPDGGDGDVLRPDISFILNENMSKVKTHIHGAPDLICEVLSDQTRSRDPGEKADRYLKNNVKEYWVLDPDAKTMQVWYNEKTTWNKNSSSTLKSRLLDGFVINSQELFR